MNAKKKGQKKETLAANTLKKAGWEVLYKSYTVRRGPFWVGLDFAHLFDIVAVRLVAIAGSTSGALAPEWLFLSVKSYHAAGKIAEERRLISAFREKYGCSNMRFEMWRWKKGEFIEDVL